jgi:hypothetical protein
VPKARTFVLTSPSLTLEKPFELDVLIRLADGRTE